MQFLSRLLRSKYHPFRKCVWRIKHPHHLIPNRISYHSLFWAVSIVCLIVTLWDRLWIAETDGDLIVKRGSRTFIPKSTSKWGDWVTSWVWIITSRTLIVSLNMSFVTVMWILPNYLDEALPSFIDSDIRHSNLQIHKFSGIWLNGVAIVLHVVLLFLPTVLDGTPLQLMSDGFDFNEWWDPCIVTFKRYINDTVIYFTYDEIFRLLLSLLCFLVLMPLSRADWMLSKSYSVAMAVHAFAGFAMMFDMVRKNSHPLCHFFNIPFIGLYCLDRIFSMFFYRVNKFTVHKIERVSQSSFILYGRIPNLPYRGQGCGDNYWLMHLFQRKTPMFQRAHPYTAFQNWDESSRGLWNVGFVISSNVNNRHSWSLWLMNRGISQKIQKDVKTEDDKKERGLINHGFESRNSWFQEYTGNESTVEVQIQETEFDLRSYGPYRSSFYVIGTAYSSYEYLVLIAGGSGFGFFISALTMINNFEKENPGQLKPEALSKLANTTILYSSRETEVMEHCKKMLSKIESFEKCTTVFQFTGVEESCEESTGIQGESTSNPAQKGKRMDIDKHLSGFKDVFKSTLVCACASSGFLDEVKRVCYKYGLRLRVEEI